LSLTFGALADPTRRAILARLAKGGASVTELAEPFDISLPAVSKHLKVLERAGLIERGRDAQWRPCRLQTEPLSTASEWLERYKDLARDRLDRLDQEIQQIRHQQKGQDHGRH
jgi:DNA-binding transcriptional ArsR family regulator